MFLVEKINIRKLTNLSKLISKSKKALNKVPIGYFIKLD